MLAPTASTAGQPRLAGHDVTGSDLACSAAAAYKPPCLRGETAAGMRAGRRSATHLMTNPHSIVSWSLRTAWLGAAACIAWTLPPQAARAAIDDCDDQCRIQFAEPALAEDSEPATPLISFRKGEDEGANPLRPASTAPAEPPVQEPPLAEPQYALPIAALPAHPPAKSPPAESPQADSPPTAPVERTSPADVIGVTNTATPPSAPIDAVDDYGTPPAKTISAAAQDRAAPTPAEGDVDARRLAPRAIVKTAGDARQTGRAQRYSFLPTKFSQLKSLSTAGAGLAVVVGLFIACMWLVRRNGPKPTGILPVEAFAVLGRAPLTSQSVAQLLRIGNKLVLVAVSAEGAQPLAEVTDESEVDRIAGLCMAGRPSGSSAEFQQVLAQLSREPAKGFLGREGSSARRRA